MRSILPRLRSLTTLSALLLIVSTEFASAQELAYPDKPPSENWFVDDADLIRPTDRDRINEIAQTLWSEQQIPIYVVTIPSLATYNRLGSPITIEYYAHELFNSWGIGSERRNFGMLLLVSLGDRKARIELGASWGVTYNVQAQQLMNTQIIPAFKRNDYSAGILAGVTGMDAMARGLELPRPKQPWWVLPLVIGGFLLIVGVIISLFRSGRKGWGFALLGALVILLFFFLKAAAASRGSGAGFGGGSSGGGGATGSW